VTDQALLSLVHELPGSGDNRIKKLASSHGATAVVTMEGKLFIFGMLRDSGDKKFRYGHDSPMGGSGNHQPVHIPLPGLAENIFAGGSVFFVLVQVKKNNKSTPMFFSFGKHITA